MRTRWIALVAGLLLVAVVVGLTAWPGRGSASAVGIALGPDGVILDAPRSPGRSPTGDHARPPRPTFAVPPAGLVGMVGVEPPGRRLAAARPGKALRLAHDDSRETIVDNLAAGVAA